MYANFFLSWTAIVTRAALKGMADSVGVFIPILKSSADTIKTSLNNSRRKTLDQHENLADDTKSHKSFTSLVPVVEEEQDDKNVDFVQEDKPDVASLHKVVSLPPVASPSVASLDIPQQQQKAPTITAQTIEKPRQIVQPAPVVPSLQPSKSIKLPVLPKISWISIVKDSIGTHLLSITQFLLFLITVYMMILYFKSEKALGDATDHLQFNNITESRGPTQDHVFGARLNKSLSRSVYLRDLDEGFLKNSILPPYSQSQR